MAPAPPSQLALLTSPSRPPSQGHPISSGRLTRDLTRARACLGPCLPARHSTLLPARPLRIHRRRPGQGPGCRPGHRHRRRPGRVPPHVHLQPHLRRPTALPGDIPARVLFLLHSDNHPGGHPLPGDGEMQPQHQPTAGSGLKSPCGRFLDEAYAPPRPSRGHVSRRSNTATPGPSRKRLHGRSCRLTPARFPGKIPRCEEHRGGWSESPRIGGCWNGANGECPHSEPGRWRGCLDCVGGQCLRP